MIVRDLSELQLKQQGEQQQRQQQEQPAMQGGCC